MHQTTFLALWYGYAFFMQQQLQLLTPLRFSLATVVMLASMLMCTVETQTVAEKNLRKLCADVLGVFAVCIGFTVIVTLVMALFISPFIVVLRTFGIPVYVIAAIIAYPFHIVLVAYDTASSNRVPSILRYT